MFSTLIYLSLIYSVLNDYDLENGHIKFFHKISKGEEYIFYIKASNDEKLEIKLDMDYINNKPFDKIFINEYPSRNSSSIHENYYNVSTSQKDGNTFISETYSVLNSSTKFVSVQMIPDYDIRKFRILIKVSRKSILNIVLLGTLVPLCFSIIVFTILFIILMKREKKKLAKQNNQFIAPPQPKYDPEQPQDYLLFHPSKSQVPLQPQLNQIPLHDN